MRAPLDAAIPEAPVRGENHPDVGESLQLIFRVHKNTERALNERLQHVLGISLSHARVLLHVARSHGIACVQLARRVDLDAGYISRLLPVLEQKNLIEIQRSAADRRIVRISPTPAGAALAGRVPAILHEAEEGFLSVLDEHERDLLCSLLRRAAGCGEAANGADGTSNVRDD